MTPAPRNVPRFLPTLTEVIDPSALAQSTAPAAPDLEEVVGRVMKQVDLLIQRRVQEETHAMLRTMLSEHAQSVSASLRLEFESVVRVALADALTSHKSGT